MRLICAFSAETKVSTSFAAWSFALDSVLFLQLHRMFGFLDSGYVKEPQTDYSVLTILFPLFGHMLVYY